MAASLSAVTTNLTSEKKSITSYRNCNEEKFARRGIMTSIWCAVDEAACNATRNARERRVVAPLIGCGAANRIAIFTLAISNSTAPGQRSPASLHKRECTSIKGDSPFPLKTRAEGTTVRAISADRQTRTRIRISTILQTEIKVT